MLFYKLNLKYIPMKTFLQLLLVLSVVFAQAQDFKGLDKSPMDKASYPSSYRISDKIAAITYSRPQLRERSFNEIVPFNKVWRTGANEATELRVFKPIGIGGTTINAGTYSLYTLFEEGTATLIVNADTNVWGAYRYNQKKDIVRITVPYTTVEDSLEAFSIAFSGGKETPALFMGWEKIRVEIPFTVL